MRSKVVKHLQQNPSQLLNGFRLIESTSSLGFNWRSFGLNQPKFAKVGSQQQRLGVFQDIWAFNQGIWHGTCTSICSKETKNCCIASAGQSTNSGSPSSQRCVFFSRGLLLSSYQAVVLAMSLRQVKTCCWWSNDDDVGTMTWETSKCWAPQRDAYG